MAEGNESRLRCDTCGRETDTVSRVVVDAGYNRANARAIYNCPDCYQKKLRERVGDSAGSETEAAAPAR
jgi:NAD-dependent SIR2 family protein deacetylase